MPRPLASFFGRLDAIYCDQPYFVGVKARLLAVFNLFLIAVFPINIVKVLVSQPPHFEIRVIANCFFELSSLISLRLIFRGKLDLAGTGQALAFIIPTQIFALSVGDYPEAVSFGIQFLLFSALTLLMAIVFASLRVTFGLLGVVVAGQVGFYYLALHRRPVPGSTSFAADILLPYGIAALCLIFVLALSLRHMMEGTHRRSEEALRQTRLVNENLERLVAERTSALVALNEEKNAFMGMAAHDLRNPAVKIRMIAEMVEDEGDYSEPRMRAELATIAGTATRMLGLLNGLLDVNAIEEGRIPLHLESLDARAILREVHADFHARAVAKGLDLVLLAPAAPAALLARLDGAAIRQVLDNLVSNALKFSPAGKPIWLSAEPAPEGRVRFAVRDEGPGLSAADRGKLFGKFGRLSAQPTGGETSHGLGLSIVKRLVEGMGGAIVVDSVLGEGATFRVEFPAA